MISFYREYTNNDSFHRLQNLSVPKEIHVVLAFARDYDTNGKHTDGSFKTYFDQKVTPQMISNFKKDSHSTVNFFLCIGDRDRRYPFTITNKSKWISNATSSLGSIIQRYGFDGIDVYYPRINASPSDFTDAIGTVIENLMNQGTISVASIAPSTAMNASHYVPLYQKYPNNFASVVYQSHDQPYTSSINDAQGLINVFTSLVSNYPRQKLLAGHSIIPEDWATVPYSVVLGALSQILSTDLAQGTSVWAVSNHP